MQFRREISEEQDRDGGGDYSTAVRRTSFNTFPIHTDISAQSPCGSAADVVADYMAFGSPLESSADDSRNEIPSWSEGQRIEARDCSGTWYVAKVMRMDASGEQGRLRVHFEGWSHEMDEMLLASSPNLRVYAGLQCFGPGGSDDHSAHLRLDRGASAGEADPNEVGTEMQGHPPHGPEQPLPPRGSSRAIQTPALGMDPDADAVAVQAAASASVEEELFARLVVVSGLLRRVWMQLMTRAARVWVALRARLFVMALPLLWFACLILAMTEGLLRQMLSGEVEEERERGTSRCAPLKAD